MTDDDEKSSSISAIALAALAIVVALFTVKFGLQTMTWVEGKMWATQTPWLNVVPQALPTPPPVAAGPQLKAFDFEVNAPWPGNPKPVPAETNVAFHYDTGQVLVFFVLVVAAAEVVVGLGIVVAIFRRRASTNADDLHLMKG